MPASPFKKIQVAKRHIKEATEEIQNLYLEQTLARLGFTEHVSNNTKKRLLAAMSYGAGDNSLRYVVRKGRYE